MTALNWRDSAAGAAEVSPARAEMIEMAWEYFIFAIWDGSFDSGCSKLNRCNCSLRCMIDGRLSKREAALFLYSKI